MTEPCDQATDESTVSLLLVEDDDLAAKRLYEMLSRPEGTRFECQELRLELAAVGEGEARLVPQRAVATWEGSRVKTFFERDSEVYVIEADRLEWNRPEGDGASDEFLDGEAVLYGKPTLRKLGKKGQAQGTLFEADRALVRLGEERVIFESSPPARWAPETSCISRWRSPWRSCFFRRCCRRRSVSSTRGRWRHSSPDRSRGW